MVFLLRHHRALQLFVFISFSIVVFRQSSVAEEAPFPVLTGLEDAVQFWKQVFTRLGASKWYFLILSIPAKSIACRGFRIAMPPARSSIKSEPGSWRTMI